MTSIDKLAIVVVLIVLTGLCIEFGLLALGVSFGISSMVVAAYDQS